MTTQASRGIVLVIAVLALGCGCSRESGHESGAHSPAEDSTPRQYVLQWCYVIRSLERLPKEKVQPEPREWSGDWIACSMIQGKQFSSETGLQDGSRLRLTGVPKEIRSDTLTVSDLAWTIDPLEPSKWLPRASDHVTALGSNPHKASVSSRTIRVGVAPRSDGLDVETPGVDPHPLSWVGSDGYKGTICLYLEYCVTTDKAGSEQLDATDG